MPSEITVVTGPARSGKTARLVALVAAELARGRQQGLLGTALWLTPNFRAMDGIRQRLLAAGQPAVLGLSLRTFDQFAEAMLGGAVEAGRPLSKLQKRRLLGQVLRELHAADKLDFFAALADRPSLVEALGRSITELKRRGISPATLAKHAKRKTASARDRELATIYAEYQSRLDTHKLYDADDKLARASELVRSGELGAFDDLRLIVVHGLPTFTPGQLELLQAWDGHVEQIVISLELSEDADRPELFATTRETLQDLRERFAEVRVEHLPASRGVPPTANKIPPRTEEGKRCAALDYLARHLFTNPRTLQNDAPRAHGIEIIAAANQQDEVLQVARRVKRLLVDGVPARDILVTARSLSGLGTRIHDVFEQFGIPLAIQRWRTLGEDPLVRTLIALLELDASDWPFRKLVRLLTNRRIAAWDGDGRRGATEWIVRDLQFAKGRESLLKAVNKLAANSGATGSASASTDSEDTGGASGTPARQVRATLAESLLIELADALGSIPPQATPLDWCAALEQLAKRLGIAPEYSDTLKELRHALRSAEQLATWQNDPPPELDRGTLLELMRDIASHESLPERTDEAGCVRMIGAPTARLLPVKHLFVMGLVEQSFPPPEPVGELYSDRELDALAGARRTDDERPDRGCAEMLLFYELVNRSSESVVFSYAALDEKAQPQFPSPYLQDVERIFGPGAIRCTKPEESLRPVPSGPPASDFDWRLQAVDRALKGAPALLAGLTSHERTVGTARSLLAGLDATHHRARGDSFGPFEGVFAPGPAHLKLAKRFDGEHLWSPSQLELYAQCPFKFLMEQVCRFEPPGELLLDTDPLRKGTLAHEALAILHRKLRERVAERMTVSHLGADTLREEYLSALDEARKQLPPEGVIGALADLERAEIARWAEAYAQQHSAYDEQWRQLDEPMRPSHFEVRFGPARGSTTGEDQRSTDEPFVLQIGDEALRFTGRIDRIDVGRMNGQTVLTIVDYKSGSTVKYVTADVEAGKQLQLVLYAMAAEQHLFRGDEAKTIHAGYWALAEEKLETRQTKRWVDFHQLVEGECVLNEDWSKTWQATSERITDIIHGIRHGEFPMHNTDPKCTSFCDFKTVCRVAVARNMEKVWPKEQREPLMDADVR
ncbi:MAG: PD-(D/E)XK nuclease family protein [Pirellulales bacterium]